MSKSEESEIVIAQLGRLHSIFQDYLSKNNKKLNENEDQLDPFLETLANQIGDISNMIENQCNSNHKPHFDSNDISSSSAQNLFTSISRREFCSSSDPIVDILFEQNALLDIEVNRLCAELDELTKGTLKRGYLFKWREREMSFASKWGLRFFELKGSSLSYFEDDNSTRRPIRTIDLSHCIIRNEGTKKSGQFHVFGIYLRDTELCERGPNSGVLLRLSSENAAEAEQWMDMLQQASDLSSSSLTTTPSPKINTPEDVHTTTTKMTSEDIPLHRRYTSLQEINKSHSQFHSPLLPLPSSLLSNNEMKQESQIRSVSKTLLKSNSRRSLQSLATLSNNNNSNNKTTSNTTSSSIATLTPICTQRISNHTSSTSPPSTSTSSSLPTSPSKSKHTKFNPRAYPASKSIHIQNNPSPLSSDVRPGDQNYRGFFHLGLIIFIISHFRLIIDNLTKYGFLLHIPFFSLNSINNSNNNITSSISINNDNNNNIDLYLHHLLRIFLALLSWNISIFTTYFIEYIAANPKYRKLPDWSVVTCNTIIGVINIIFPVLWVWYSDSHPLVCMLYLFQSIIIWMKLISYVHANRDVRLALYTLKQTDLKMSHDNNNNNDNDNNAKPSYSGGNSNTIMDVRNIETPFLQYPMNITISNLLYFCIAPTLCYQLNYPRSPKIRWDYIITYLIRLVFVLCLIIFFIEQYIIPNLEQSIEPMRDRNIFGVINRLSKLCIPNTYVWLFGFYLFFHLWLNLLAELTRFGDRVFYKDWWNARTIDIYWRTWNLPVHHWILRHLYYPLLRAGISKTTAVFIAFFFSAALHELVISTPFRRISFHAFLGMMAQAPLTYVTKHIDKIFDNALVGNVIFWILFCIVGQPMGIIMYYYDIWKDSQ